MRIAEVARIAQVTPRAIRHYHRVGVLPEPARSPNGYREYSVVDLTRLLRIRRLLALGLPLTRIRNLIEDSDEPVMADHLEDLEQELREQILALQRQLDAVRAAQESSLSEAPALYDGDHWSMRSLWSIPEVRRIETDVTLLFLASGDAGLVERLRHNLADPARTVDLARVSERLRAISEEAPDDERDAVAAELAAAVQGWSDLDVQPGLRALVDDYLDRSFNSAQLDVIRRAARPDS